MLGLETGIALLPSPAVAAVIAKKSQSSTFTPAETNKKILPPTI
ncbi:hypothetical protein [Hymenobacter sp. DG25B]|nr:hypothetical protein [Hymenobacter sp. DG25B]